MIGLARYTHSILQELEKLQIECVRVAPGFPWPVKAAGRLLQPFGYDVQAFCLTYPLSAPFQRGLIHLPAQQMASLLWLHPGLGPAVVTVHDIIPFLVRDNGQQSTFRHPLDRWFDQMAMSGLSRADRLISDSYFTKKTIMESLDYPEENITVVHLGVEHDRFRPQPVPQGFCAQYRLDPGYQYILFVGSENPRKNLSRLLEAFAIVRTRLPQARLIKIGSVEYQAQAGPLRQKVRELGIAGDVIFVEHVSDEELAAFYNLASLFVFPSLYEGFGLPPLEAMACGTPVVCSNAASLPEVVEDAALTIDPYDVENLADAMLAVLSDPHLQQDLRERGLQRAAHFTWERTARETLEVYERVLSDDF